MIKEWLNKEAKWWQFWLPQTGFSGGVIFALSIIAACVLFTFIFGE